MNRGLNGMKNNGFGNLCIGVLALLALASCKGAESSSLPDSSSSSSSASSEALTSSVSSAQSSVSSTSEESSKGYESLLFDQTKVHAINITISDEDWADLLKNATAKTKYKTDITIDGETISQVSFSTKGNTSLTEVFKSGSHRFSFKVNFGKYTKKQTYHGLDKLNLNNVFADATYMKDWMSYEIMEKAGVAAPLTSYVNLTINGKAQGLYLAIEDPSDSFIARVYGDKSSQLYKPEAANLDFAGGGAPTQGNSIKGSDLKYTDDNFSSYSDIFDNAETSPKDEDKTRLIQSLKKLAAGELENCLSEEANIRYFAASSFVLNFDSYMGPNLHNYYLYETNGLLTMLPWDFNLAFGTFGQVSVSGNRSTVMANFAIDTPLPSDVNAESRPFWAKQIAESSLKDEYHTQTNNLIASYFDSGDFAKQIDDNYSLILPFVKSDATAFYTEAKFAKGYQTLRKFCLFRVESVKKQLNGTIAKETSSQNASTFVDASSIDVNDMGTMAGGGIL
jgi:spore coat protein CotH